jgi:hypothetical protein
MALAHGGRPKQAMMVANEARASSARWRRTRSLRRRRKRRSGRAPATAVEHDGHDGRGGKKCPIGLYLGVSGAASASEGWSRASWRRERGGSTTGVAVRAHGAGESRGSASAAASCYGAVWLLLSVARRMERAKWGRASRAWLRRARASQGPPECHPYAIVGDRPPRDGIMQQRLQTTSKRNASN